MKKIFLFVLLISIFSFMSVNAKTLTDSYPFNNHNDSIPDAIRVNVENWISWRMAYTNSQYYSYYLVARSNDTNENEVRIIVCTSNEKQVALFNQMPRFYCDNYYLVTSYRLNPNSMTVKNFESLTEDTYFNVKNMAYGKFYTNMFDYTIPYEYQLHPDVNVSVGDVTVTPGESSGSGSVDLSDLQPYFIAIMIPLVVFLFIYIISKMIGW